MHMLQDVPTSLKSFGLDDGERETLGQILKKKGHLPCSESSLQELVLKTLRVKADRLGSERRQRCCSFYFGSLHEEL